MPGKRHDSFKSLKGRILERLSKDELQQWMKYTVKGKFKYVVVILHCHLSFSLGQYALNGIVLMVVVIILVWKVQ